MKVGTRHKRCFLLSQSARRGPWNDCANLRTVVETAAQQTPIGLVLAEKS